MSRQHLVEVNRYTFFPEVLEELRDNAYASGNWPLVYVLSDEIRQQAYIGETTDAVTRMGTHLKHDTKKLLTTVHLISSASFNKSATLDIESQLIKYMAADGRFTLLNGNLGLVDHNYYQKDELYSAIFQEVWNRLRSAGLATQSIERIDNSDVFKYSPYKSLSYDQRQSLMGILYALLDDSTKTLVVEGGAGTGKSVLAIFLFKLLNTDEAELDIREFSDEEDELRQLLQRLKQRYPRPKMALIVPMASFRQTLKKAFQNVAGLRPNMVIGPAELAKNPYDIVFVDESHRLRKRKNLGAYYGAFDKACEALGFDKHSSSEVDWVIKQSAKSVFFYDEGQSIKPSDANVEDFIRLKLSPTTQIQKLSSQFRVRGGQPYAEFVDKLLNMKLGAEGVFKSKAYDLKIFDSIEDLVSEIAKKEKQFGLARLIAGYAWPWVSKNDPDAYDIQIENIRLCWNKTSKDWINSDGAKKEVGCIHTTQGYDLNYAGIIFGKEIRYDKSTDTIFIDRSSYFDRNGQQGIKDDVELKQYIINIYKTIMLRGIRGTFVYACDEGLRKYLKRHIPSYEKESSKAAAVVDIVPYVNAVPLIDLQVAAGDFSDLQIAEHKDWQVVPAHIQIGKDHFACKVVGDSMNRVIPNGATCLFRTDPGGSRNGKIVLVECADIMDADTGSRYTVKDYESHKMEDENGWHHEKIVLKPRSHDPDYKAIELTEDQFSNHRVVGIFVQVL